MPQFKPGDLVILKDGDHPMKVQHIGAGAQGHTTVRCTWFVAGLAHQGDFRPGQLRAFAPESRDVANPPLGS
jgi:uncharacterized protein YodC (DUF2158 family)